MALSVGLAKVAGYYIYHRNDRNYNVRAGIVSPFSVGLDKLLADTLEWISGQRRELRRRRVYRG